MKPYTLAVTGHRPPKLGGYGAAVFERLVAHAKTQLVALEPTVVNTGMALGWDQAVAKACWDLKIQFRAYVPFVGQEHAWPRESQLYYELLLRRAARVVTVCEGGYAPWKMQRRNEAMVDAAERLLALWDGSAGGTANCVAYAMRKGVSVHNCWRAWAQPSLPLGEAA